MITNIIAVGDIHLGWNPKFLPQGKHDKYISRVLASVTEQAIANDVDIIALLGDVFDVARPNPQSQRVLSAWLVSHHKLAPHIKVVLFTGNHDNESLTQHSLQWLEPFAEAGLANFTIISKPTRIAHDKLPLIFLPWMQYSEEPNPKVDKLLNGPPAIVFAHTEVKGSKMDNGWLADGIDLTNTKHWWLIGHLHTEQLLHKGRVDYVGTPTARHWNHEVKGVRLLTVDHTLDKINKVKRATLPIKQPYFLVECVPPKAYAERTFYRVRLQVGQPMPEHPQVVSANRLGEKPSKAKAEPIDGSTITRLPPPKSWLLDQLNPAQRERAQRLIDSIKLRTTSDDI